MTVQNDQDLHGLRAIGQLVATILTAMRNATKPGVSTAEIDQVAAQILNNAGARSGPILNYDFPGHTCISVNDEVVHGIPGQRRIEPGDVVKLDVVAELNGYFADSCVTELVPPVREEDRRLSKTAKSALRKAIAAAVAGRKLNAIGRIIDREVSAAGFSVIPELAGHGVGRKVHEDPQVLNYEDPRIKTTLQPGMVLTIEPIIAAGSGKIATLSDGWTVVTKDQSPAAHWEHTVIITEAEPIILTLGDEALERVG